MSARPILFLDVDGVLNCYGLPDSTHVATDVCPVEVPAGTRDRVHLLLDVFELVWATAWRGAAHGAFREVLDLPLEPAPYLDWADVKLPAIVKYAGERPWAFVDDDVQWELGKLHPAFAMLPNTLILDPDPRVGLTDAHVVHLLDFAESLGTSST